MASVRRRLVVPYTGPRDVNPPDRRSSTPFLTGVRLRSVTHPQQPASSTATTGEPIMSEHAAEPIAEPTDQPSSTPGGPDQAAPEMAGAYDAVGTERRL